MTSHNDHLPSRGWRSRWAAIGAAVAVTLGAGTLMVADAASSEPSSFVSVDPARILDTRTDVGLSGPFVRNVGQKLRVTGSVPTQPPGNVPPTNQTVVPAGATAVTMNATVVTPRSGGFLAIRPGDATGTPATSNINLNPFQTLANSITVQLPTSGSAAGTIDIFIDGEVDDVLIDIVGYYMEEGQLDAKSAKTEDVTDPSAANYGVALSVTVEADSVGIIQIVGSAQVLTVGSEDQFDCVLTRGSGATTNSSDDDLADSDRHEFLPAERRGNCTTNGTVAVGEGTHVINLVVRKDETSSLINNATLQALFIPGGELDNTN